MEATRSHDLRYTGYQIGGAVRRHWMLGLLLGINLIFGGWALIFMALHARPTSSAVAT